MMIHVLYFDGASRGNPGQSSYGAVLYDKEGKEVNTVRGRIGCTTNNVSEYCALIYGMEMAYKMGCKSLVARGDSQLVIQQVQGLWTVRDEKLRVLYYKVKSMENLFVNVIFEHINRNINIRADQLANLALDAPL